MPTSTPSDAGRRSALVAIDDLLSTSTLVANSTSTSTASGSPNPLDWVGYDELRASAEAKSGVDESVVVAVGATPDGDEAVVISWSFAYLGGSMGSAAGQRIAGAYDLGRDRRLPIVLLTSSGGARMQEGMASLVQMAATTVAAQAHAKAGLLQVAVLRHPTTGGVFASHANLADVILAEAGATIGFAGPRVAEAMTGGTLPAHSHTAVGARAAGLADDVISPGDMTHVRSLLRWATLVERSRTDGWSTLASSSSPSDAHLVTSHPDEVDAWASVLASRHPSRARATAWLAALEVAGELHGDRAGGDDPTVRVVLAVLAEAPVVVVALDRDVDDGAVTPSGFRKAWRGFDLAERLGVPLVTLVDTKGADASASAEAGGAASHIARTFARLLDLDVPTLALVTGEGGSGGAMAISVCDRLVMLANSTFSVIAPEGAAAILHRDPFRAPDVAAQLKPDAATLHRLGIADAVVTEEGDPVTNGWQAAVGMLAELTSQDAQERRRTRLDKWRSAPSHP